MSIIVIVLGMSVLFVVAYFTYGKFLATKVYELNDKNVTLSVEMEDGLDYVPTDPKFLLGQHFSAIAAAGPITGPIIAGVAFG
jgi:carbon starvation protein